jgi:predicted transcriptional regulator
MSTTIKVSTELRDRLEALGFAIRSTPPELLDSYRDETSAWSALDA